MQTIIYLSPQEISDLASGKAVEITMTEELRASYRAFLRGDLSAKVKGVEKEPDTFHEKLVRAIQDVGQDLINNAEDYAGTSPYLSRMTITIDFDPENGMGGMLTPEIDVDKTYLCGTIVERLRGECDL